MLAATSPICIATPWLLKFTSADECPQEIMLGACLGLAVALLYRAKGSSRLKALSMGSGCYYLPQVFSIMFMSSRLREEMVAWFPLIVANLFPNALLSATIGLLVWEAASFVGKDKAQGK